MLEFVWQTRDKVLQMGEFQRSPHLLIRVSIKRVQVHAERAREQHRVLPKEEQ